MDVSSLYKNIPHAEEARWVDDFYDQTLPMWGSHSLFLKPVDTNILHEMMLFILHTCTFDFNELYFTQLYGTTMGAKFSVTFTCLCGCPSLLNCILVTNLSALCD